MLKKLLAPVSLHALCRGCGTCTTLASRRQHCLEVFSKVRQKLLSHTHIPGRPYHHGLLTVLIYIRAHILTVHMPHTASVVEATERHTAWAWEQPESLVLLRICPVP